MRALPSPVPTGATQYGSQLGESALYASRAIRRFLPDNIPHTATRGYLLLQSPRIIEYSDNTLIVFPPQHLLENPNFRSSKCHGCEKQMKTKGQRLDGIVFTNADPRYAGKLDDPQGGDATMLMQQVREVMTVNQEMTDESSWIWLTSEQMGFPLPSEFANENHGEAGSSKQRNELRPSSQISFETQKGNSMMRSSKTRLKC